MKRNYFTNNQFLFLKTYLFIIVLTLVNLNVFSQSITYSGPGFVENSTNDGTVNGSITAELIGDSFTASTLTNTHVTLGNVPAGFTTNITTTGPIINSWSSVNVPTNSWQAITYGNGLFVAVASSGTNRVMTSPDGITWTPRNTPNVTEVAAWYGITYGNGVFVAVGDNPTQAQNNIMTSTDGITWTLRQSLGSRGSFISFRKVVHGGSTILAVGAIGGGLVYINYSTDNGTTWNYKPALFFLNGSALGEPFDVAYGNNTFVLAAAIDGNDEFGISTDAINWTYNSIPQLGSYYGIAFGNNTFVAVRGNLNYVSEGDKVLTSTNNGVSWTERTATEPNTWRAITFGGGLFVALSEDGTNRAMFSQDGISWTKLASSEQNTWQDLTYGNGKFVAVSKDGTNRVMVAQVKDKATLTLSGSANPHTPTQNINDISFSFLDAAFTNTPAANVTNAVSASSNQGITFFDKNISYSGSFHESTDNDGSMTGSVVATISGETFANAGNNLTYNTDYAITNMPSGLTPTITVAADGLTATLTFSGKATSHRIENNITDLVITFNNSAFTGNNATEVGYQLAGGGTGKSITFYNGYLHFSGTGFMETAANDGTVSGSIVVTLTGETFNGQGGISSFVTISPSISGLTKSVIVSSDLKTATLTFSGKASSHGNNNDISNISFTFNQTVFTGVFQTQVGNAVNASSNLGINFHDANTVIFKENTTWNSASNWSTNNLPLGTDNVAITSENTVTVDTDGLANNLENNGTLAINSGNSLTINGNFTNGGNTTITSTGANSGVLFVKGTSTGNVTYERGGLLANNWHIITAPVSGQSIKAFVENTNNNIRVNTSVTPNRYAVGYYDDSKASGSKWVYYTATDLTDDSIKFEKGSSYAISRASDGSVSFTGTLEVNTIDKTVTGSQWNAIGNSFTTFYPVNKNSNNNFLADNTAKLETPAIYIWDKTQQKYVAVTNLVSSTEQFIPPGQGFFIKPNANTTLQFDNNKRSIQPSSGTHIFNKSQSSTPFVKLFIDNGTVKVNTDVIYSSTATTGFDANEDIENFSNSEFDINSHLVANSNGKNYTIQSLPNTNIDNYVIPISIDAKANNQIVFSASLTNLEENYNVYLEDREAKKITNLKDENSNYTITPLNHLSGIGRFYLHTTQNVLRIGDNVISDPLEIFVSSSNVMHVNGLKHEETKLKMYNIIGGKILTLNYNGIKTGIKNVNHLKTGLYVISLRTPTRTLNKKIFIE
ncbi:sialidase family protein [uncultured Polaribacter sp.]|uniref:beta strand repeat-containing protein n=1 Tax=uncultured Polaribacter sp. TaxID=174711 RepID=UPI00259BD64F|nr:sialidase family protein [uncultured Polaribacter sp.]